MTLRELLDLFTPTHENQDTWVNLEHISRAVHIPDWMYVDDNGKNTRLTRHWIECWCCTDTWVGIAAWYLDGELVGIDTQPYRKSDPIVEFVNEESAVKVKTYLETLIDRVQYPYAVFNIDDELHAHWLENRETNDTIFTCGEKAVRKRR